MEERWSKVDAWLDGVVVRPDASLTAALVAIEAAGMPMISVSAAQGKWLHLFARAIQARRILEVGTLGGYSAIWLASALPADGRLVTLELEARYAAVARANLERAGVGDRVDVRVGPAADTLAAMVATNEAPFDLCFIDADKPGYPTYLRHAIRLVRPGGAIVADNVVREGGLADMTSTDPSVLGVRETLELMAAEPRLSTTVIQTVGDKGYDGFALGLLAD
jgi:predicted O-methyltransferase YrrM